MNWRFVDKPSLKNTKHKYIYLKYKILDKTGEIISYIVTKKYQDESQTFLHLIDFLTPNDKEIYKTILNFLVEMAKTQGIDIISLYLNKYHPLSNFLKKYGFKNVETKRVYIIRTNNNVLNKKVLFDEKNHFFTMGDSDIF